MLDPLEIVHINRASRSNSVSETGSYSHVIGSYIITNKRYTIINIAKNYFQKSLASLSKIGKRLVLEDIYLVNESDLLTLRY